MRKIKLCSDDFGLSNSIDQAIIGLVTHGRLNAVSCMTLGATFEENIGQLLEAIKNAPIDVELGLHVTLTEYNPLVGIDKTTSKETLPSIGKLLICSHLGKLSAMYVEQEILAQLARFENNTGSVPQFMDGHQHAHVLPVICPVFTKIAKQRLASNGWVRSCWQPLNILIFSRNSLARSVLIASLSTKLRKLATSHSLKTNGRFLGVNDFNTDENFAELMQQWLAISSQYSGETLIMCHPGVQTSQSEQSEVYDPIVIRRPDEYDYLSSQLFADDLKRHNFYL